MYLYIYINTVHAAINFFNKMYDDITYSISYLVRFND